MIRRIFCSAAAALLLAGCATTEPGWKGAGAVPFGTAERDCKAAGAGIADETARSAAFEQCMAGKGWTRG